jgi:ferredoxin-NADP reductase
MFPLRDFIVSRNIPLAEGVFSLTLRPHDGSPMFSFQAGQWVMLYLDGTDGKPWKAPFSIASAPSESTESFELAIKVYGDFTRLAQGLRVGDVVRVQGPFGVFCLRPGTDPLVMIAAGIGITPLRSMYREMEMQQDARSITLLYTNRMRHGVAYEQELYERVARDHRFHLVSTLTGESDIPDWKGEYGRITYETLRRHIPDLAACEYVMCGPKIFMDEMREALAHEGVDVLKKVRKEIF